MAQMEFRLQSANIPYQTIRFFVCDSRSDVPSVQSRLPRDIFIILDEQDDALVAGAKFDARYWEDAYDEFDDTPNDRAKLDQLASRVTALEDIL